MCSGGDQMKFIKNILLAFCLSVSLPMVGHDNFNNTQKNQQRAMYAIVMDNGKPKGDSDREAAGCTAYAISDHVLLTAEHCNLDGGSLYLNPEMRNGHAVLSNPIEVSEKIFDHQDHMLLVIHGIKFKYHIKYEPRVPVQGEHVYFFGNPSLIHDQYREGYVTGSMESPKDADVDASATLFLFALPVVGGDSGSSIFSADGTLIALCTFGIDDGQLMGGYALAFTSEQIKHSEGKGNFKYLPDTRIVINVIMPTAPKAPEPPLPPQTDQP